MDRPDLELLRGAIDMHAHTGPALFERHIDDAALAEYAMILLFVALACIAVSTLLGTTVQGLYNGFNGSF